ncbi:MAG: hypothetical protein J7K23_07585 [Thermoproteales archaeon]|nr:hypothetical protein [Thermoproteales archaeon]
MMKITVRTIINPTEEEERVVKSITNFFNLQEIKITEMGYQKVLIGEGYGSKVLKKFYYALRKERVLDAARQYLQRGKTSNKIIFYLNKQVAYIGRISFSSFEYGESPLGAIVVEIETNNPKQLIQWLTPRTKDGKPIEHVSPPDD